MLLNVYSHILFFKWIVCTILSLSCTTLLILTFFLKTWENFFIPFLHFMMQCRHPVHYCNRQQKAEERFFSNASLQHQHQPMILFTKRCKSRYVVVIHSVCPSCSTVSAKDSCFFNTNTANVGSCRVISDH